MKITWYGHACFKVESAEGAVVLDPYSPGSVPGLKLPALTADAVMCSHSHSDHNYAQGVKLTENSCGMKLSTMRTFHDSCGGSRRGENAVAIIEADGLRAVHLGDLGHMLSREQIAELGRPDVLMLPVGGVYTIDAETADKLVKALSPGIVIPMHYKGEGFGLENIAPVEQYLKLAENVRFLESCTLDTDTAAPSATVVMKVGDAFAGNR